MKKRNKKMLLFSLLIIMFSYVFLGFTVQTDAEENVTLTIDVNGGIDLEKNIFEIEKGSTINDVFEKYDLGELIISNDDPLKNSIGFYDSLEDGNKITGEEKIDENTTIYVLWEDLSEIESINITLNAPKEKDNVEINEEVQSILPDVTIEEEKGYSIKSVKWINGLDDDTLFEGDFTLDNDYYAYITITAEDGYGFDDNTYENILVNDNEPLKIDNKSNKEFSLIFVIKPEEVEDNTSVVEEPIVDNNTETEVKSKTTILEPSILYSTHVQNIGWQEYVSNGAMAGTSGKALRLEGIKIKLENSPYEGNIEYRTHIQNIGWETSFKKNDEMSGTSGKSYRLEGIEIKLTGEIANHYDVYYRVHAQNFGWLGWARNGERSGTSSYAYRLEGIEIKLVKKGTIFNEYGEKYTFIDKKTGSVTPIGDNKLVAYTTHVQNIGWQQYVTDGKMAGTQGQALRLEGIKIKLVNQPYAGDIEYRTHIQNIGWETSFKKNDEMSGTSGKAYRLEAIEIKLTGEMANHYDVYYRVHAQNFGWLGWARNGEQSGTSGYAYRLEGIEIKLLPKGTKFEEYGTKYTFIDKVNGKTIPAPEDKLIQFTSYLQNVGWLDYVTDGNVSGTNGLGLRIEGFRAKLVNQKYAGDIEYRTHVQNVGWESTFKKNNEVSGTLGKGYRVEAIEMKLTGEMANHYDIYYRAHVQNFGWLNWAKNGESAGTQGFGYRVEAIEVRIVGKDEPVPAGGSGNSFIQYNRFETDANGVTRFVYYDGSMARDWITVDGTKYFFNSLGVMIAANAKKVIDVSTHDGDINWAKAVQEGGVDGAMIRAAYRGWTFGSIANDDKFQQNVRGALSQGIPIGAYFYSQALTVQEAQEEAYRLISLVELMGGKNAFKLPLVIDTEYTGLANNSGRADNLTVKERTDVVEAFLQVIENAGYEPMIYASTYFYYENLDMSRLSKYKLWVAQYAHYCKYNGPGQKVMWQYSSTERIPGINTNVDINVMY